MTIKKLAILPTILAISACGGGPKINASEPTLFSFTNQIAMLEAFGDGGGVVAIKTSSNNEPVRELIIAPDASNVENIIPIQIQPITKVGEDEFSNYFTGTTVLNGIEITNEGRLYLSKHQNSLSIKTFDIENAALIGTAGTPPTSPPTSGSFTYEGTNVAALRNGNSEEAGKFNMTVDFGDGTTGTASLNGTTTNTSISASNMAVDVQEGTFSSNNATISGNWANESAKVQGSLHGTGATGVSGVYYDDVSSPDVAGAFIGTKQQ